MGQENTPPSKVVLGIFLLGHFFFYILISSLLFQGGPTQLMIFTGIYIADLNGIRLWTLATQYWLNSISASECARLSVYHIISDMNWQFNTNSAFKISLSKNSLISQNLSFCRENTDTHCSKSSFFVKKFNFHFPRKLSIFLGEKLAKMLWFWTF